ncbi:MAG TPA: cytochrome P450 [Pseudonocardia sp.]|nr:cytochrome P450 [Pseudonocardia sp.]
MAVLQSDPWDGFSLDDAGLSADFDGATAQLVEQCPVAYSEKYRYWMISRYADVKDSARDWGLFSSAQGVQPVASSAGGTLIPIELDPPVHTRWRQALQPFFSSRVVGRYAEGITAVAHELIDRFVDRGHCDLAAEFCGPLPGIVLFQEVLGTPVADTPYLIGLIHQANVGYADERAAAWAAVGDYVEGQLRERQSRPRRDDLLQRILELDLEDAPCSWAEKKSVVSLLISGGLDTTAHVLGGACRHLATHPDARRDLRADPERLLPAVEEYLRYWASAFAIGRTTTRETEIAGRSIPAGARVMMGYGAACRDPAVFERPAECDLNRSPNRHLAFGFGPHACIGAHLARLELRLALRVLLDRLDDLALDSAGEVRFRTGMMRIAEQLPVTFTAATRPVERSA